MSASPRRADVERETRETRCALSLVLDGAGRCSIATGIGFLDHLLEALAFHARFDLDLHCAGDLEVDDHHVAEDCALLLGRALDEALGERSDVRRFASAHAPLDEALARAVVDLAGRPWPEVHLHLRRERLGTLACENVTHVLRSLAIAARLTLHVDLLRGDNDHHRAEAAFKAVALALREAIVPIGGPVPSTKGAL
ncbi:MAG: imidazoleglycerol-phosphate dehydratase HisB [Acidobacteriota bacterium]|nr:imidazoleglycerol-phosphate dehydratase HisB [Acidobacteriota bacterium]